MKNEDDRYTAKWWLRDSRRSVTNLSWMLFRLCRTLLIVEDSIIDEFIARVHPLLKDQIYPPVKDG